jgi:hypothetical protein
MNETDLVASLDGDSPREGAISITQGAVDAHDRLNWAMSYHINDRRERLEWDNRPYLVELYRNEYPFEVFMKSAQCGISELAVCDTLLNAGARGLSVMYVLPTKELVYTFVKNRVDKPLYYSNAYRDITSRHKEALYRGSSRDQTHDSVSKLGIVTKEETYTRLRVAEATMLKDFGDGRIVFAGSNSEAQLISHPVDLLWIDEYDTCHEDNVDLAKRRLDGSKYQWMRICSTPMKPPGMGIHAKYMESDRRKWLVKCQHCGNWSELDWFENVVQKTESGMYELRDRSWRSSLGRDIHVICDYCDLPKDRFGNDNRGEWVPEVLDGEKKGIARGYHINKMMGPRNVDGFPTIHGLWNRFKDGMKSQRNMERFYNMDLGMPFEMSGSRISEKMLNSCVYNYMMPDRHDGPCCAGGDIGNQIHLVICSVEPFGRRLVFCERVSWDELPWLLELYNVDCCVLDINPETHKCQEIQTQAWHKCWIFLCRYNTNSMYPIIRPKFDFENRIVTAERTITMDDVFEDFHCKRIILPVDARAIDHGDFYRQMKASKRFRDKDGQIRWTEGRIPDHYHHAFNYNGIAYRIMQSQGIGRGFSVKDSEYNWIVEASV